MSTKVVILGAGFGGLELSAMLSESGADFEVTLIDRNDAFVFGFSKLDLLFGRTTADAVRHSYADFSMPGVTFRQESVTAIDPENRVVTTSDSSYEADALVIALGADYDLDATPGLAEFGNEFYSVPGAERLSRMIPEFTEGHAVIGICGAPFKCPPAPSECSLMLHDNLVERGVRDGCQITLINPLPSPVPPSPEMSAALCQEFEKRGIELISGGRIQALDGDRGVLLEDGSEIPFDIFFGVPRHRAPDVVIDSGLTEDGFIPVDSHTLEARLPGVYAVGDVVTAGVPKAGVFSEGAARIVAGNLIAGQGQGEAPGPYLGRGNCYIEFGEGKVSRVDIDFLSGPQRTGVFNEPSLALAEEKVEFGRSRQARWFGT
jgi:sulfide:quinone oxidoreductase